MLRSWQTPQGEMEAIKGLLISHQFGVKRNTPLVYL